MKKLMAMFAICSVVASTPSWAALGLGDLKFDGSLEVRGNSANNETDFGNDPAGAPTANDHRGSTATRLRFGVNAPITEGVAGRVELVRGPRQYGTGATTVAGEEALWTVQNAYADLTLWDHLFRLGRQYVGNPGDLVWNLSPTEDDNLTTRAIDGLLVQCRKFDFIHADFFTGKAVEDDTITGATTDTDRSDVTGDVNLTSLDFVFPKLIPEGKLNVGYLLGDDSNSQLESDNNRLRTYRVGVNGGVSKNMFTYRAEFFGNMGEFAGAGLDGSGAATKLKYQGSALDLGVGANTPDTSIGKFGLWLNYLMASGDDNVTDDKDKSFHDFSVMGVKSSDRLLGEIFGKSNVLGGSSPLGQGLDTSDATGVAPSGATQGQGLHVLNIGVNFKPTFSAKSWFRFDFYTFARAEDSVKTGAATNADVGDKFGTEFDLAYGYDQSDNVGLELGYAMLNPDDALKVQNGFATTGKDDAITKLYARAKIKWGGEAQ